MVIDLEKAKDKNIETTKQGADSNIQELLEKKDTKGLSNLIKENISDYKNSEMFKNYLKFVASCPHYSSRNLRFLQKQKPDVGLVGSFGAWKNQGYHVKKGEHGLKIFMPCTRDKKDVNGNKILDKNGKPKQEIYAFKLGTVFETHQLVEYENLPKPVAYLPDNPDDNRKLFFSITKASDVPIKVLETTEMCSGANGFYSPTTKEICLSPDLKGYQRIKTLLHEITHSKLHKESQEVFGSEKYALQELEAESTAFVVANYLNIDTKDYSIGYLNSWGFDKISDEQLENVMKNVQATAKELIEKIDIELEKYVAPVPKKSMTMKERIDKAKTKLSEKKPQETEFYGREILEAIQLTNKFPTPKKVLIEMLEEMIQEQLDLIDKEELNHYIHAKKYVQTLTEEEVKNVCFEVKDLYEDVLKEFEINFPKNINYDN